MAEHAATTAPGRSVVWVDEVDPAEAVALAGSKMGRLTELHRAGVEVPQGFAVTVDAYRRHCSESGLDPRIEDVISRLGTEPTDAEVEKASAEIRSLFEATPMSEALEAELTDAYEELCLRCVDVNVPTAVRSSATGEDAADASFAGIFDTYLGISGPQRVIDAVRKCWGSLFTSRALAYRLRKGISHHAMPIAVGVIELIHARASGVGFSVHPVTGKPDRIVIETSWGWGEAIVQGLVNPDHVEVGKADGRLLKYDVAHKTVVSAFDFADGAVTEIDMPAKLADRKVLDDEQIAAIAAAIKAIEEHYGYPVDVEWVISRHRRAGDPVCIVQSRPVTVTAAETEKTPAAYDPVALAQKFVFSGKPIPGR
ncbi:MAG: pyruvate, water dikinase [Pseudonocardiales bacterium]|jgi:pyruvate,water dikinase|uniref:PEP/pyruvate-binding domain-containing protein n=1 Tax=Pseudonocardia sp. TaxID=60912 RepID=UPI0026279F80|nr:PEP/pyruvate-binding domain-containing protein [Pseudonocardia sp.]MCW2717115.1 Pyruvate, water dikinase [Pseudonocardia sp.]MDT7614976.1 pyruvate, water dikinase [Pseudonocardiales bacterium]MDT7705154.1 pyruvate, water dikinase [Pseudonocardiales bacterium]